MAKLTWLIAQDAWEIQVSELKNIKWFGDNTIKKLIDEGITSIEKLVKVFKENEGDFTKLSHILTWIQQKQFSEYLKTHPELEKK